MNKHIGFVLLFSSLFIYSFSFTNFSPIPTEVATVNISGRVLDTNNEPIKNAIVYLDEPENKLLEYPRTNRTDENGYYTFNNNPTGYVYQLSVQKDGNHTEGVSTLDFMLMIRHMLGIEEHLHTPYKIIAADLNADNRLTQLDLIQVRKLSLGVINKLPNNEYMRFIYTEYKFPDPKNPWPTEDEDPYSVTFKPTQDSSFDFVGVRIADVTF